MDQKQIKLAVEKGGKPGDVPKYEPVTAERINSTEFPRARRNDWLVDRDCVILDGSCNCERIQGVLNCKYNTF